MPQKRVDPRIAFRNARFTLHRFVSPYKSHEIASGRIPLRADYHPRRHLVTPLPQYLSDRFGWPEMVEGFAARYNALPPDVRTRTAIFCRNYGEASAVNVLGPRYGLPTAISGHQNYFYWGWNGYTGESVLTLGNHREDYLNDYDEVVDLGAFDAA